LEKRKEILEDAIEETVKNKGVLLIPAFAMERTQELLFELNDLVENGRIPRVPVFIDSPLAIKITAIYKKYSQDPEYMDTEALTLLKKGDAIFDFPGLKMTLTSEQSKEINDVAGPKVIIAGAGMSQGGRILHHERRYLSDPKSAILFIGYQVEGSLGRRILDGAKSVKIFGEEIPVNCKIKTISGYSAHADQPMLINWLEPMKNSLKKVFIVKGEQDQMIPFSVKIRDELAVETAIPTMGETVML
jgi:metallo-beta-lactamase family protein